jgi:hypothetical protein
MEGRGGRVFRPPGVGAAKRRAEMSTTSDQMVKIYSIGEDGPQWEHGPASDALEALIRDADTDNAFLGEFGIVAVEEGSGTFWAVKDADVFAEVAAKCLALDATRSEPAATEVVAYLRREAR